MAARPWISRPSVPLKYSIAQASEHSGRYVAENILVDCSTDQASRWSGAHQGNIKQFIVLRLDKLSILKTITFGKFHKAHPCNMKEFKIYVGVSDTHMTEVLHGGLKNDSIPETFCVKHLNNSGVCFPTRFVKIVPVSAHGQSFHTSIWHVAMTGITDETLVDQIRVNYEEYRETTVLRHLLKHLRQRRLLSPYRSILSRSNLQVEHPLVTQLHENIVLQGNWSRAEELLLSASQEGLFDAYLRSCQPYAIWTRLHGVDADGDIPSRRGGHAMCIDHQRGKIYLLGGWDGKKSLDDFWVYDISTDKWTVLSHSTSANRNGPGPRSCHKMVFDSKTECIYVLGRLSDADALKPADTGPPSNANTAPTQANTSRTDADASAGTAFCSEFFRYHASSTGLDKGKWDLLSFDTAAAGGPPLVFDHQMVIDSTAQILYVFGGRVVDGDWNSIKYSGLYSYNVRMSKWKMLQPTDVSDPSRITIPPRYGHSMVLDSISRKLYIFAGQRDDKYLSDMYAYDLGTHTAVEIYSNFSSTDNGGGPDPCFTQRAVIDPELHEIYVFCGLTRNHPPGSTTTLPLEWPNWVYRYDTSPGKWMHILPEPESGQKRTRDGELAPVSRYAHQVVYDPATQTVFMHGGNAGLVGPMERGGSGGSAEGGDGDDDATVDEDGDVRDKDGNKERRLDDLWSMKLTRPAPEELVRRATFLLRRQQFKEMCEEQLPVKALNFLQTQVSAVVDHKDPKESEIFRSLLMHLLALPPGAVPVPIKASTASYDDEEASPRKRSRPNTPEESWTNKLDDIDETSEGETVAPPPSRPTHSVRADSLRSTEDPEERKLKEGNTLKELSGERFEQRTAVFEALLDFVADEFKEPSGNLVDMVDGDEGGM